MHRGIWDPTLVGLHFFSCLFNVISSSVGYKCLHNDLWFTRNGRNYLKNPGHISWKERLFYMRRHGICGSWCQYNELGCHVFRARLNMMVIIPQQNSFWVSFPHSPGTLPKWNRGLSCLWHWVSLRWWMFPVTRWEGATQVLSFQRMLLQTSQCYLARQWVY